MCLFAVASVACGKKLIAKSLDVTNHSRFEVANSSGEKPWIIKVLLLRWTDLSIIVSTLRPLRTRETALRAFGSLTGFEES